MPNELTNVLVVEAKNGDSAVFARVDETDSWLQVEATKGKMAADIFAKYLDQNSSDRIETLDDCAQGGTDWGESVPAEDPNATTTTATAATDDDY
jgi:hypothetical protein